MTSSASRASAAGGGCSRRWRLTRLDLSCTTHTTLRGLQALAESSCLGRLTELSYWCPRRSLDAAELLRSTRLAALDVTVRGYGGGGGQALVRSSELRRAARRRPRPI
ncbi:MAG: hypothetical protein KC468_21895 [Myxococcales bacterium]|nr:hypothetical protein [Myxococcales bacterium]